MLDAIFCFIFSSSRGEGRAQRSPPDEDRPQHRLSVPKVVVSPLQSPSPASPAPPRTPSPVLSSSPRHSTILDSESPSSDLDHVQRELLRAISIEPSAQWQTGPSPGCASRSSLGTVRSGIVTRNNSASDADRQSRHDRRRRHGVLWDVDAAGWRGHFRDADPVAGILMAKSCSDDRLEPTLDVQVLQICASEPNLAFGARTVGLPSEPGSNLEPV